MRSLIISIFSLFALSSCMHFHGDIGDYFGTWKVTEISVDNTEDSNYNGNIFFQFQSDVVRLVQNRTNYDSTDYYGTWSESGNTLILDFGYKVNPESEVYNIPEITRLVKGDNILNVNHVSAARMDWTFTSNGQTISYSLKKQ